VTDATAQILDLFRSIYSTLPFHDERHLADCPSTAVAKHEIVDEDDFQFTAILRCDHSRLMGFSRGPKEEGDDD